jgi:hypothetical protein
MSIRRIAKKLSESNTGLAAMLIADADKALIDLDVIRHDSSAEEQSRKLDEGLIAYNAIFERLPRFTLSAEQIIKLDDRMSVLRERLIDAGRIQVRRRQVG